MKIRYPGVERAVESDLALLGTLSVPFGGLARGFDLEAYRGAIAASLAEELDYGHEAAVQRAYYEAQRNTGIVVPRVVDELSSSAVLTTTWEDGETLSAAASWPDADRRSIVETLLRHLTHGLFEHGRVHADPHPGNYRFRRGPGGPEVVLYDYGCTHAVEPGVRLALLELMSSPEHPDPLDAFVRMGFSRDLLSPIRGSLDALVQVLFEPFASEGPYDVQEWRLGERTAEILGEDRWNFRISAPATLVFLMRAFQGVVSQATRLGIDVRWRAAVEPFLGDPVVRAPRTAGPATPSRATGMRIRVTRGEDVVLGLTLPAEQAADIRNVVGAELARRIEATGACLDSISANAVSTAFAPQRLFALHDPDRTIEVDLVQSEEGDSPCSA